MFRGKFLNLIAVKNQCNGVEFQCDNSPVSRSKIKARSSVYYVLSSILNDSTISHFQVFSQRPRFSAKCRGSRNLDFSNFARKVFARSIKICPCMVSIGVMINPSLSL